MFSTDDEDVLNQFALLCRLYPNESTITLWEQAGGIIEAAQPREPQTSTTAQIPKDTNDLYPHSEQSNMSLDN